MKKNKLINHTKQTLLIIFLLSIFAPVNVLAYAPLAVSGSALAGTSEIGFLNQSNPSVYFLGTNNHVYVYQPGFRFNQGFIKYVWDYDDLTSLAGTKVAASGSALASMDNVTDVYYLGSDNHVYEILYTNKWVTSDLTSLSGAKVAASRSSLTSNNYEGYARVYYLGNDNHVYELAYMSNPGHWECSDVTGDSNGKPALKGSALTAGTLSDCESGTTYYNTVSYQGNDNNLYTAAWDSRQWFNVSYTNAVPATRSKLASNNHFVFYLGSNNHVYMVCLMIGYSPKDLTEIIKGRPAAIGSALLSIYDSCYYLGSNNHVYKINFEGCSDITSLASR